MADSQWDADDFRPKNFGAARVVNKWEGEDEDDNVKDNWDDEDEEAAEPEIKKESENNEGEAKAIQVKKKNITKNKLKEKKEKLKEAQDEKESEEKIVELTPEELYQEKLRRQQLQEESDLQLAKDAFGINNDVKTNLDNIEPSSREEFDAFRKSLVDKLTKYERSIHYPTFLEELLRDLCINMEADDIKKLGSTLNALSSEKVKAAKALKTKKKASTKKASLVVGKANEYDFVDYGGGDEYDDFM